MDKWFEDILSDKDPYHDRGRDQMRKKLLFLGPAAVLLKKNIKVRNNRQNTKRNPRFDSIFYNNEEKVGSGVRVPVEWSCILDICCII
jgi:hypothetical protein